MFQTELGKGFFTIHQIMSALMSGFFLGMILKAMLMLATPDAWQPKYQPSFISLSLCFFLFFVVFIVVIGHVALLRDKAKLKRAYKQSPSARRIKFAKLTYWPVFAFGAMIGYSANNELFFLPI